MKALTGIDNKKPLSFNGSKVHATEIPSISFVTTETEEFQGTMEFTGGGQFMVLFGDGNLSYISSGSNNLNHHYSGMGGTKKIQIIETVSARFSDITKLEISGQRAEGNIENWPVAQMTAIETFDISNCDFSGDLSGWATALANWSNISLFYIYK